MKVIAWPAYSYRDRNPYTALLYESLSQIPGVTIAEFRHKQALLQRYDVLHVHWPDIILKESNRLVAYFYVLKFMALVKIAKARGTKLIWTMHNLKSHERYFPGLEKFYSNWFIQAVDGAIALSHSSAELAKSYYPQLQKKPIAITPHGHYRSVYPNTISRAAARQGFGYKDNEIVLLFLGQIRPYKNLIRLIQTFRDLPERQIRLLIAGKPDTDGLRAEILKNCQGDERIQVHLEFIRDQEIQNFLHASDLVVLPYKDILNSGSAILSLSFGKPVLVPEKGSMSELKALIGSDWVYTYADDLTATALSKAIFWCTHEQRSEQAPLEPLDWNHIAQQTLSFYQEVASPELSKAPILT